MFQCKYFIIAFLLLLEALLLTACPAPVSETTSISQNTTSPTSIEKTVTPTPETTVDAFSAWWEEYRQPFTLDASNYNSFYRGHGVQGWMN